MPEQNQTDRLVDLLDHFFRRRIAHQMALTLHVDRNIPNEENGIRFKNIRLFLDFTTKKLGLDSKI